MPLSAWPSMQQQLHCSTCRNPLEQQWELETPGFLLEPTWDAPRIPQRQVLQSILKAWSGWASLQRMLRLLNQQIDIVECVGMPPLEPDDDSSGDDAPGKMPPGTEDESQCADMPPLEPRVPWGLEMPGPPPPGTVPTDRVACAYRHDYLPGPWWMQVSCRCESDSVAGPSCPTPPGPPPVPTSWTGGSGDGNILGNMSDDSPDILMSPADSIASSVTVLEATPDPDLDLFQP